ncbi:hypothetical protein Dfri01_39290 [Dyadobacter frigoris]|uniref:hypothetical protein n=1 Tax=Dyadobacter frigoris TaxID=2576211 RepID=UPI0024A2E9D0|nr:hypothetical protein [Dyadobacter frigoris]GLU54468.1 hypothetical protein Dfri01_39290 [Dyadobacter frigoris]
MVKRFEKNLYHLSKADSVVKLLSTPTMDVVTGNPKPHSQPYTPDLEWVKWGKNDSQAIELLKMCWDSPSKPRLMDTAKEFIIGAGVKLMSTDIDENGKEVRKIIKDPELKKWFRRKQIYSRYLELAALSLHFAEIAFVRFSIQDNGVVELETIQPNKVRFKKPDKGMPIEWVYINPYFGTGLPIRKEDTVSVRVFDKEDPEAYPESIIVLKKAQIGSDFYTQGLWWGTKTWTQVDNMTPEYHLAGLVNGYNFKLLIEIDESYFMVEGESLDDENVMEAVEKRKDDFMAKMDEYLSGVKNTDKALVLIGDIMGESGKGDKKLIRITPIENKMTDDAYMNLIKQAGVKQAQGHGILPSLAGISEGDKLGGSGSELMHSVMYHVRYMTPSYRRLLKEPLDDALEVMGYDLESMEYQFTDVELTTLDANPTGQQAATSNLQ